MYHVLNRGNDRRRVFRRDGDYAAFVELLAAGKRRADVALLGFCVMPNHWHLLLRPDGDGDLAAYLSWVTNTHVKRYRAAHPGTSGHLYQGRYKSFPVQDDPHLLTVLRYAESNPLRGERPLVPPRRAQDWPWSSLSAWLTGSCGPVAAADLLDDWPVDRPADWLALVNAPQPEQEAAAVRAAVERGRPLGDERWVRRTAAALGLESTLRPRGRPRKAAAHSAGGGR